METKIVPSLGMPVGQHWQAAQRSCTQNGIFHVAAPLSSTPLPVYKWVIENAGAFSSWDAVKFVLMDEQVDGDPARCTYVPETDAASYEMFARREFLDELAEHIGVQVPVVKPSLTHIENFSTPIDLLVLALGVSGNFANVMPGTPLSKGWHIAELTEDFRTVHTSANSNSYAGARFRNYGMSLGPQQVVTAGEVLVIVSGKKKASLYRELMTHRGFSPRFPLSIIHHPDVSSRVTVYATYDVINGGDFARSPESGPDLSCES